MRTLMLNLLFIGLALGSKFAWADDDEHEKDEHHSRLYKRKLISAPKNAAYKEECASCHMLYPAGLLPERSWKLIMAGLDDHYGDNASLNKDSAKKIEAFLIKNAADHSQMRRSRKISQSIPAQQTPLRITETFYFKRQHHEVSSRVWKRKAIGSPSNCVACHKSAESGIFSEDEIRIPR